MTQYLNAMSWTTRYQTLAGATQKHSMRRGRPGKSALVQSHAVDADSEIHSSPREQPLHHLRIQHCQDRWNALAGYQRLVQIPCADRFEAALAACATLYPKSCMRGRRVGSVFFRIVPL